MGILDLIGHKYPNTDFHELNLDWCITAILQMQKYMEDFSAGNKLTFADPLQHDLTKTYAKNTIVVDSVSGTAYLSLAAVPVGVQLDNTDYWLPVFDFAGYVTRANQNFTDNYFSGTDRTPIPLSVDEWVVLDDVLYKVTVAMAADDLFIIGTNIVHFTVEQFLKDFITSVNTTLTNWYNQMIGTINQYKNDIDASELAYRQQLAQDIADTTASLQAQLDAAISGATVDSEVINARVGINGFTYPTLGEALRTQVDEVLGISVSSLNGEILTPTGLGAYISTSGSAIDPNNPTPAVNYNYYLIPCKANDRFVLNGAGGSGARFYAFVNVTYNILYTSASDYVADNLELIAPFNSSYLLVNDKGGGIQIKAKAVLDNIDETLIKPNNRNLILTKNDMVTGAWLSPSGTDPRIDRFRSNTFYKVYKGDIVRLMVPYAMMTVLEKNISGQTTSFSTWIRRDFTDTTTKYSGDYVVTTDCWVALNFAIKYPNIYNASTAADVSSYLASFNNIVTIIRKADVVTDKEIVNPTVDIYRKAEIYPASIGQDGCFINGKLWCFYDGDGVTGEIKILDLATGTTETKYHSLGHANSVSYNRQVDTLCLYGSNGDDEPTIVLYEHPEAQTNLTLTDAGCKVIPLYDADTHMNISASVCYGEDYQILYFMDGPEKEASDITGNWQTTVRHGDMNIYKIRLGLGSNDLSSNGYGIYDSSAAAGEYNGTCEIIKTYTGEIAGSTLVSVPFEWHVPQGMDYDGYIYLAYGVKGINNVKIELDNITDTYRAVDNYKFIFHAGDFSEEYYEPELLALDGAKLYSGISNGVNSYLLEFNK